MAEITLEQRVALVAAWLQRAERLARGQTALSMGDLPPGYSLTAEAFILRQCTLARQAAEALESAVQDARRAHADTAAMAAYKRAKLPEQVAKGTLDAPSANAAAAELAERIDRAREAAGHCEALLRLLSGEVEATTPKLPLFQYALTWREFQEAPGAVAEPEEEPTAPWPPADRKGRSFVLYYRRLQRSDKIAIIAAILGSVFILTAGYLYMYVWGRLIVEVQHAGDNQYRVSFTNSYGETVSLNAPYDGTGLSVEDMRQFGIAVEVLDQDGRSKAVGQQENLWTYKDQPAHLYGPILISPLTVAELTLQIPEDVLGETPAALRLILYKAPNSRCGMETIPLDTTPSEQENSS